MTALDALLEFVGTADAAQLRALRARVRPLLEEISHPPGTVLFVLIEADPMLWLMRIRRVIHGAPHGPVVALLPGHPWPSLFLSLEAAAAAHTRGRGGHRFEVQVGPDTSYVLRTLPGSPDPRCRSIEPTPGPC